MSIFNQSQSSRVKKNKFDLSHDKKLSTQMGKLVPILVQEILPGDNFRVNSEIFMRLAPMVAPIMHNIDVTTHYFFVPNRIIWDNWEDFITGGPDGTSAPVHPHLLFDAGTAGSIMAPGTLADYMGLPQLTNGAPGVFLRVNALPFRAYTEIYNQYYRDQTLETEIFYSKGDGQQSAPSDVNITTLRFRAWEKDYFTSALPWAQRGPEVIIPGTNITQVLDSTGAPATGPDTLGYDATGKITDGAGTGPLRSLVDGDNPNTIRELRKAEKLQQWLERNARGGARYIEQLLSHFGIAPNDARLQRPEYLGGGRQPVTVIEFIIIHHVPWNSLHIA